MKEFSLEEYLAHPKRKIVTRDGRKVRIVCTDRTEEVAKKVAAGDEEYVTTIKAEWEE